MQLTALSKHLLVAEGVFHAKRSVCLCTIRDVLWCVLEPNAKFMIISQAAVHAARRFT